MVTCSNIIHKRAQCGFASSTRSLSVGAWVALMACALRATSFYIGQRDVTGGWPHGPRNGNDENDNDDDDAVN